MKSLIINILSLVLLASLFSCSSNDKSDTTTNQEDVNQEQVNAEPKVRLDANVATLEQMEQAMITDGEITRIIENRPFSRVEELMNQLEGTEQEKAEKLKVLFIPLNLNTATEDQFKSIPGVGDKMAHEFVEYRPYLSIKQFRREMAKYVDAEEIERYETYVFVPIELNSATEEEILALPGVGEKMAHEFLEYRPYKNLEQFRKEIGKYVDDQELKRLESMVYLK